MKGWDPRALGDNPAGFMQGEHSAEQALGDVIAAYTLAAKKADVIK